MVIKPGDVIVVPGRVKGRADTKAKKKAALACLMAYWLEAPEQRLGQLLCNAMGERDATELFYAEDAFLLEQLAAFCQAVAR